MSTKNQIDQLKNHIYDGIQEFDNPLPRWWLFTFFGTILFSFIYWGYFETLSIGLSPEQALAAENEVENKKLEALAAATSGDDLEALAKNPQTVARGKALFAQNCVVCHGAKGQGGIGANLTDSYWIHGPHAKDIKRVISKGVLEKGMTAWESVLGNTKINDLTAYLLSIKNTHVAGKAPEGQKYE